MTAKPVSYETQLKSASVSLEVLCEQGVGQGEVGMHVHAKGESSMVVSGLDV